MKRDTPIAMTPDEFRATGHALVDQLAALLASRRERPVAPPGQTPADVVAALNADAPLPRDGAPAARILEEAAAVLIDRSLYNAHPQFYGYITSSPAPIGALADLLAAAVNPNVGSWILSPVATTIESQTVRWLGELIGYREGCGGVLVSGGNMANMVGFLAARRAMLGADVRTKGLAGERDRTAFGIYGSAGTHTWIDKACDLFGFGTDAFRRIDTDAYQRMRVDALRAALERDRAAGVRPLLVVATAGSVSTGAVDPIRAIAQLCRDEGIWLHVDGAYGGFAAAVPDAVAGAVSEGADDDAARAAADAAADLGALALADSVAIDPHKWLYAPLEAGALLARDPQALRDAYSYHPPYYHFGVEATNYVDMGLQNSRGFRALKVWLALRQVGRAGYERMIADDIALARRLHTNAARHPELEAATLALSIATFRYVPPGLRATIGTPATEERLNRINTELLDRLQKGGEAFVSNAVIGGRYLLRACIVNFNTTAEDVDALPEIVARVGREVAQELAGI